MMVGYLDDLARHGRLDKAGRRLDGSRPCPFPGHRLAELIRLPSTPNCQYLINPKHADECHTLEALQALANAITSFSQRPVACTV